MKKSILLFTSCCLFAVVNTQAGDGGLYFTEKTIAKAKTLQDKKNNPTHVDEHLHANTVSKGTESR